MTSPWRTLVPESGSEDGGASSESSSEGVTNVDLDEPCPNCGEMFGRQDGTRPGERLPEKIDGEAIVRRMKDGALVFEVQFPCPVCGLEFLVEDLTDGTMTTE